MKKIFLLLVISTLVCFHFVSAGEDNSKDFGKGWGTKAPNSGDGIPDGPGR